jgi:transposase
MYLLKIIKEAISIYEKNILTKTKNFYTKITKEINKNNNINVSRHSVSNWINNKINLENRILRDLLKTKNLSLNLIFKDKNTKIKKINYKIIKEYIKKFPFSTVEEIKVFIYNNFNIKVSNSTITKLFKILNLTRKKVKFHIIKDLEYLQKLEKERLIFIDKIKKLYFNKIIFIDESGFNVSATDKGLSIKGEKINIPKKNLKSKNLSLLMAITKDEILNYDIYESSINKYSFYDFIKKIINNLKENSYTFVFDNVSFHKDKEILKLIIDSNNNYLFTPPYSPNLNPIENTFGIIKSIYKKELKINNYSTKDLIFYIQNSILIFNAIYKSDLEAICKRALNYSYIDIQKELKDRIHIYS